jgi:AcrR family transcriptional regulator
VPKRVDHQARRRQIADALLRITASRGLEAVSLRQVAAEAGVSMGLVEHYFKTKEQMLRFAFEAVSERAAVRIWARLAELPDPAQPGQALRAVLHEMLPLDQTRRAEAVVGFAFLARATVEPELAALLRTGYLQLRDFTADQIRRAQAAGQVADTVDPDAEAAVLLALLDGLTAHALIIQDPPAVTLASLENRLRQLFADP